MSALGACVLHSAGQMLCCCNWPRSNAAKGPLQHQLQSTHSWHVSMTVRASTADCAALIHGPSVHCDITSEPM